MSPARIAVVHPWWDLWAHTAPAGFRESRMELARAVATSLADAFSIVAVVEAGSLADGAAAGGSLAAQAIDEGPIDAILVLQTMAVPAGYTLALLDQLPGVPVVVWAAHETGLVDGAFDHGSITTQGATVGAPMIGNMLSRTRRPFELVLGRTHRPPGRRSGPGCAAHRAAWHRASDGRVSAVSGCPSPAISTWMWPMTSCAAGTGIAAVFVDPDGGGRGLARHGPVTSGGARRGGPRGVDVRG